MGKLEGAADRRGKGDRRSHNRPRLKFFLLGGRRKSARRVSDQKEFIYVDQYRPWLGGTGNMVAVQVALGVPASGMGYVLLMDSVNYTVWVMLLLALTPLAPLFNGWTGSDTALLTGSACGLPGTKRRRPPPWKRPA